MGIGEKKLRRSTTSKPESKEQPDLRPAGPKRLRQEHDDKDHPRGCLEPSARVAGSSAGPSRLVPGETAWASCRKAPYFFTQLAFRVRELVRFTPRLCGVPSAPAGGAAWRRSIDLVGSARRPTAGVALTRRASLQRIGLPGAGARIRNWFNPRRADRRVDPIRSADIARSCGS